MSDAVSSKSLIYALAAYGSWGLMPLFWKMLSHIPAYEILPHRVIWSLLFFMMVAIAFRTPWRHFAIFLKSKRIFYLFLTALLIGSNWFVYIYAVVSGHLLEASLGYYINPLLNVAFGYFILREKLSHLLRVSILLALIAVIILIVQNDHLPWISLYLAFSFSAYSILRKIMPIDALVATSIETALLTPFALLILFYLYQGPSGLVYSGLDWFLLVISGAATSCPLWWFTEAARLMPLSTLGLLQYISPTIQFFLGVFLFHERIAFSHGVTFVLIWMSLALLTYDMRRSAKVKTSNPI